MTRARILANLPAVGLAAGVVAVLFFFDPVRHGFFPPCLFHRLTGWNCPGCGATRALHALLHGDVLVALRNNALAVGAVPGLAGLAMRGFSRRWHGRGPVFAFQPAWLCFGLAVMVLFTVLRNLPAFAWLSPP